MATVIFLLTALLFACHISELHQQKRTAAAVEHNNRCHQAENRQDYAATLQQTSRARQTAEKQRQRKEEASSDLKYYVSRMDDLQEMIWAIDSQLETARKNLETDRMMNQFGAVITEKTVKEHTKEYTKLQNEALRIENQIHALEKKIARAQYILAS